MGICANRKLQSICLPAILSALIAMLACSGPEKYRIQWGKEHDAAKEVRVSVPSFIEVRSVDDESVGNILTTYVVRGESEIYLPLGLHTIVVRYIDIWPIDENEHMRITSDPVSLSFEALPGQMYCIVAEEPQDLESALALESSGFTVWIEESRTGKRASQ